MQLIELQSFAPIVIWAGLAENTYIEFDIYDRYEKMSFRNTYTLVGSNGPLRLSVPLVHGRNQRVSYSTVKIDNSQRWQQLHWKTIISVYNRSPWFEFYQLELKPLYEQPYLLLSDWNAATVKWLLKQLKYKGDFSILNKPFDNKEGEGVRVGQTECHDLRNVFAPKNLSKNLTQISNYNQVFQDRIGFIPYASILDLIFCEGPHAKNILQQQATLNSTQWQNLGKKIIFENL